MAAFDSAFVTGAGGFIGRHLVQALLAEKVRVVALMLPGEPVPVEWGDAVQTVTGDVRNLRDLKDAVGPVEVVFHLAAIVSDWGAQDEHVAITVGGTEQAIELALAWDAHFIVTTSVCAYASSLASGDIDEDTPVGKPSSPYEFCKQEQERVTRKAVGIARLKGTIVRPGNVFGVGSGPWVNTMLDMLRQGKPAMIGSGDWDAGLCHVRNLVALMIAIPGSGYTRGDIFTAADGFGVTWNTYLHRLTEAAGIAPPASVNRLLAKYMGWPLETLGRLTGREERPAMTRQLFRLMGGPNRFSTDKARRCLGYTPVCSFEQAMQELADHFGTPPKAPAGPWIWVTGAASGLGRKLVGQLLQKGRCVLATDQDGDALAAAARDDYWPQSRVRLAPLDVSVRKQWQNLFAAQRADGLEFSHLLNVAGIIRPGNSFDNTARDIGIQVKVNLTGTLNGCDTLLPHLAERGAGHIINIGSLASFGPVPGIVGYTVSKSAVRTFSNGLAMDLELAGSPVKVSCVCPDLVATPMLEHQLEYGDHARIVFSGDRVLSAEEVVCAILGPVWDKQPMEYALPASRATISRLMGLHPALSLWGARRLEEKGRRSLQSRRGGP